jgi:uncharacterized membrane protein YeaQ/YmgE (transglycosylase-associated protein family)
MYLVSWIIVGIAAGWLAGKILKGNGYGPLMDIAMGICGAVVGGLLIESAGFPFSAIGEPSSRLSLPSLAPFF